MKTQKPKWLAPNGKKLGNQNFKFYILLLFPSLRSPYWSIDRDINILMTALTTTIELSKIQNEFITKLFLFQQIRCTENHSLLKEIGDIGTDLWTSCNG